ncbi:MAG TPA: PIN domain-containing protein [Polyangiaceae bacterium]|jgi:predicted nucleic acid-binding protein
MIRGGDRVFIDTGAWIALAAVRDAMHLRARETWTSLLDAGARPIVSTPVLLETFSYLQRKIAHEVALAWWTSLDQVPFLERLECTNVELKAAMRYFARRELHKLSLVDATSFVLMKKHKVRIAFTFDTHFAAAGFRLA